MLNDNLMEIIIQIISKITNNLFYVTSDVYRD